MRIWKTFPAALFAAAALTLANAAEIPERPAYPVRMDQLSDAEFGRMFFAEIDLEAGKLQFGAQATTRMAGPGLKSERAYLDALAAARTFRLDGRILTLFGEDGTPLAKFIAHTSDTDNRPTPPQK